MRARFAFSLFISNSTRTSRSGSWVLARTYAEGLPSCTSGWSLETLWDERNERYKTDSMIFVLPSPFRPIKIEMPGLSSSSRFLYDLKVVSERFEINTL